jgi:hypothetical protein
VLQILGNGAQAELQEAAIIKIPIGTGAEGVFFPSSPTVLGTDGVIEFSNILFQDQGSNVFSVFVGDIVVLANLFSALVFFIGKAEICQESLTGMSAIGKRQPFLICCPGKIWITVELQVQLIAQLAEYLICPFILEMVISVIRSYLIALYKSKPVSK